MFSIAWEYLTGRCVATDFTDRERAEWPPHPDRVFQALVASWGERGEDEAERKALEWLEQQPPPQLVAPAIEDQPEPVRVYVPVNDIQAGNRYTKLMRELLPAERPRKDRCFPHTRVGDGICALSWNAEASCEHAAALTTVCGGVTRIGHSSSLVRCWVEPDVAEVLAQEGCEVLQPARRDVRRRDLALRVPEPGRLARLISHRRDVLDGRVGDVLPPRAGELGYVRLRTGTGVVPRGPFAAPLLVFRQVGGSRLGLRQTLDATQALRAALMSRSGDNAPLLELVSGHAVDGGPLRDRAHAACLPLGFVGREHADGHLLGMALALPRALAPELEDAVYAAVSALIDAECARTGDPGNENFRLTLGRKGELVLAPEDDPKRAWNLRSDTWCDESRTWASVTPIVMDRMQNARRSDPAGWAAQQIAAMCERQGLPAPDVVLVRPVSFFTGAPAVRECLPLQRKAGGNRRMVHAQLTFPRAIAGPLLLGAGRFRGYGFCRPLSGSGADGPADALTLADAGPAPASASRSESAAGMHRTATP